MSTTTVQATSTSGATLTVPGAVLSTGNVINASKLSEKTIELSTCAQFGQWFSFYHIHRHLRLPFPPSPPLPLSLSFPIPHPIPMVWFGLTQKQERQYGFDAATNLGGRAFILQFKVSATVLKTGKHKGTRRFTCQHQQMQQLRSKFGSLPGSCFYFFPNIGTFTELEGVNGNLLSNSYMVDVADLPATIPATHRKNGYHYAYLNATVPEVTVTSDPFKPKKVYPAIEFVVLAISNPKTYLSSSKDLIQSVRDIDNENERIADLFFMNAALVVFPQE